MKKNSKKKPKTKPKKHNFQLQNETQKEREKRKKLMLSKFTSPCPNPTFALKQTNKKYKNTAGSLQHELKQACRIHNIQISENLNLLRKYKVNLWCV